MLPLSPAPRLRRLAPRIALAAVVLLGWLPLAGILAGPRAELLGTAVDTVHHAWSLWFLAEGTPTAAYWPVGVRGTVLGGPATLLGVGVTHLGGPVLAYSVVCALQVALALVGTGLLAERLGGGRWASPAAALLLLCGRPLLAQVGWGVPEGAAIGWFAMGVCVALGVPGAAASRQTLAGVLAGALLGASIVENPYTLPMVMVTAGIIAFVRGRSGGWARLGGAALGGSATIAAWLLLASANGGALDAASIGAPVSINGHVLHVEMAEARAHLGALVRPLPLPTYAETDLRDVLDRGETDYLGLVPLLLAGLAVLLRGPAACRCGLAALGFGVLALGSFIGGDTSRIPGPFLYLDLVLDLLARPLTQPARYLVPATAALALAGGGLLGRWVERGQLRPAVGFAALALAEALLLGSPAVRVPTLDLRPWGCLADLPAGPVAARVQLPALQTRGSAALLLQLVHHLPGTHPAIGGWHPDGARAPALASALAVVDGDLGIGDPTLRTLAGAGVRWLLLDVDAHVPLQPDRECGGLQVIALSHILSRPRPDPSVIAGPRNPVVETRPPRR
jgi:hypothetical protein